jgi:hypothetical protein
MNQIRGSINPGPENLEKKLKFKYPKVSYLQDQDLGRNKNFIFISV